MNFCGEITYETSEGNVHSDICFNCGPVEHGASKDAELTEKYRKFVHDCLDEWLDKSNGTGGFWLGDPSYFVGWGG